MIADSIRFLKNKGMTVFFDAEHFFDGFKHNPEYSLQCLTAAAKAGSDCLVLCDTNGGAMPDEIMRLSKPLKKSLISAGIHAHNDSEVAVANSLAAVKRV